MKKYLVLALFLSACAGQVKTETPVTEPVVTTPVEPSARVVPPRPKDIVGQGAVTLEATCPAPGQYQAVDIWQPTTQRFRDAMKKLGIHTIIRYSDHAGNETLRGKIPTAAERKALKDNGFYELYVFQHNNGSIASFTAARGEKDAMSQATQNPDADVWYYGVDSDFTGDEQKKVREYAVAFKKVADRYGKKVGAYGSGLSLTNLLNAGLVDYAWVSQSTGHSGTANFKKTNKWNMIQAMPQVCGGFNVDFNKVNPSRPDYGQK